MQERDFKWFLENYDDLYKKYGHSIIVIKNQTVLGIYSNKKLAVTITAQTEALGTFIVQECNGNESAYTNYISSWQLL